MPVRGGGTITPSTPLKSVGTGLLNVAAGLTIGAAAAGDAALKFDQALNAAAENSNMTAQDMASMRTETLALMKMGVPQKEAISAYRHVYDYQYRGSQTTPIMATVGRLAIATQTPADQVAQVMGRTMRAFNAVPGDADKIANVLHNAAAFSDMTVQQLLKNSSRTIGYASAYTPSGGGLADAMAGYSALVHRMTPARADTQMGGILTQLASPTPKAAEAAAKAGLGDVFSEAGLQRYGLSGAIGRIGAAERARPLDEQAAFMRSLFPNKQGNFGMTLLTGPAAGLYSQGLNGPQGTLAAVRGQTDYVGQFYKSQMATPAQRVAAAKGQTEAAVLEAGKKAEGDLADIVVAGAKLSRVLIEVLDGFLDMPKAIRDVIYGVGGLRALTVALETLTGFSMITGTGAKGGLFGRMIGVERFRVANSVKNPLASLGRGAAETGLVDAAGVSITSAETGFAAALTPAIPVLAAVAAAATLMYGAVTLLKDLDKAAHGGKASTAYTEATTTPDARHNARVTLAAVKAEIAKKTAEQEADDMSVPGAGGNYDARAKRIAALKKSLPPLEQAAGMTDRENTIQSQALDVRHAKATIAKIDATMGAMQTAAGQYAMAPKQASDFAALGHDKDALIADQIKNANALLQKEVQQQHAGAALTATLAKGIASSSGLVYDAIKKTFIRSDLLLPHSDAAEGPFSTLTKAGQAIPETMAEGVAKGAPALDAAMRNMFADLPSLPTSLPAEDGRPLPPRGGGDLDSGGTLGLGLPGRRRIDEATRRSPDYAGARSYRGAASAPLDGGGDGAESQGEELATEFVAGFVRGVADGVVDVYGNLLETKLEHKKMPTQKQVRQELTDTIVKAGVGSLENAAKKYAGRQIGDMGGLGKIFGFGGKAKPDGTAANPLHVVADGNPGTPGGSPSIPGVPTLPGAPGGQGVPTLPGGPSGKGSPTLPGTGGGSGWSAAGPGSALQQLGEAALLYHNLTAGSAKKKKNSAIGGILGAIGGSYVPAIGPLMGADIGSSIGGMFAGGGVPPLGRVSVVGERGAELFVPREIGTIVPIARNQPTPHPGMNSRVRARILSLLDGRNAGGVSQTIHYHGDVHGVDDLDELNRRAGQRLEDAARGGMVSYTGLG